MKINFFSRTYKHISPQESWSILARRKAAPLRDENRMNFYAVEIFPTPFHAENIAIFVFRKQ
jgi:hypothetical protein